MDDQALTARTEAVDSTLAAQLRCRL